MTTRISGGAEPTGLPTLEVSLTAQQKALHEGLMEKHERLGTMYLGALAARAHVLNPDHLSHAAHGLRELMEKLGIYLDLPVEAKQQTMKEKVRELETAWSSAKDHASSGTVTKQLSKFLLKCVEFFAWFQEQHPKRRDRTARVIRSLDPLATKLPDKIERLRVNEWDECNGFFQGVSHHTRECTAVEFDAWIDTLERFLLDRLRPRTFEDHAELDKIIAEGESHA